MRHRLVTFIAIGALAAGCASAGGAGTAGTNSDPHAPVVWSFGPAYGAASGTAPALLTLTWSVSDPDGDNVVCRLDADGDATIDEVIPNCQVPGSRNVSFPNAGTFAPSLTADDGNRPPVTVAASLTVGAPTTSQPFSITVRPVAPLSAPVQAAFAAASARWRAIIPRSSHDATLDLPAGYCLPGAAPLSGTFSDLVIDVSIRAIDGRGGILGQAGPCVVWSGDQLTSVGDIEFDSADVTDMINNGTLGDVVLHEIGHLLGVGTLWGTGRSLLTGAAAGGGTDPRFVGPRAVAEYSRLGGSAAVPVEAGGGGGTADSHWRESTFGTELMTGYIGGAPNPLSALTAASLADLGYHVDLTATDPYTLPGPPALRASPTTPAPPSPTMVVHGPKTPAAPS